MSDAIVTTKPDSGAIEAVMLGGDLSKLTAGQRVSYLNALCESLGLNPLTRPFEMLNLQGKWVIYARRDCTDQLRKRDAVSVTVVSREQVGDLLVVTTRATLPDGRQDESIGAVSVAGLKGEALANAMMKADTKAKRRATLSICGLGFADESELDGIRADVQQPGGQHEPRQLNAPPKVSPHGDEDGEKGDGDPEMFSLLFSQLSAVKEAIPGVETYDQVNALRGIIGTPKAQSELTKSIQAAKETLSGRQHAELSKCWQHCHRALTKLEEKLKPDVVASFVDADPAEDFDRSQ